MSIFNSSFRSLTKCFLLLIPVIIITGCEESLPTRNLIPVDIFSTFLTTADGRTSFPATRDPAAITFPHPPPVTLKFVVVNIFDETFRGNADIINGSMDIWITNDIDVAGTTYVLTKNNEVPPLGIPPLTENSILTIDPGDTFYVQISWPHEVNDGIKVWDHLKMGVGSSRKVSISVLAKIQLFTELPPITSKLLLLDILYSRNS